MAETAKIAQSRPGAASLTDLYTVPASTKFAGQLFIMNDTSAAITARVSIADDGAVDANTQYIMWNRSIPADGESRVITGITLGPTDKIRVWSTTAGLVFTLDGIEVA